MISRLILILFLVTSTFADQRIKVIATTTIVADLVRNVGGDLINLDSLMGPGVDPHLYKATPGDLKKLREADLIFYNGLHLEGKLSDILAALTAKKKVYAISANLKAEQLIHPDSYNELKDPHIWFDVKLWAECIATIEQALSNILPESAAKIKVNASNYRTRLENLDQWVRAELASIPESRRILITAHDAFSYFGRAYGIKVHGLQGVSTASEFGLYDVGALTDLIIQSKIPTVFSEASVPERFIEALVAAVEAKGGKVNFGEKLYSDALGDPNGSAANYEDMVRTNVRNIKAGLL